MKTNEIHMRDPFVLVYDGKYYLYGTRGPTCWGKADGFDCYWGTDKAETDHLHERPAFYPLIEENATLRRV